MPSNSTKDGKAKNRRKHRGSAADVKGMGIYRAPAKKAEDA